MNQKATSAELDGPDDYHGSHPRPTRALNDWHALSPASKALEPELPIVDTHHHLFGTIDDALHYRLDDLSADLAGGHNVIATIYVEAYESGWRVTGPEPMRPVGEVEQIVGLTGSSARTAHGSCRIAAAIVASAELTLGDAVIEVLEAEIAAGEGRVRGVRQHAATDDGTIGRFIKNRPPPNLLGDVAFRRGFAHLNRYGLSFDAWIYHTQLDELIDLADAFPDTTIVLNHVGTVIGVAEYRPRRAEVLAFWQQRIRALARRPNIRLKLGGMGMPVFGFGFERAQRPATASELLPAWKPFIDTSIDAFGTDRCLFESNFPVDKQSCSYTELWNAFKLATAGLSPDERSDLFYRTACRTYGLPELEAVGDRWMSGQTKE
jgi:predicted TIM-barrel fold metal-dependent hydrolase